MGISNELAPLSAQKKHRSMRVDAFLCGCMTKTVFKETLMGSINNLKIREKSCSIGRRYSLELIMPFEVQK